MNMYAKLLVLLLTTVALVFVSDWAIAKDKAPEVIQVEVVNGPDVPVPVENLAGGSGQPDRIPFQQNFKVTFQLGDMESDFISLPVDQEKRLVITYVYVNGEDNSRLNRFALYVNHTSPTAYDYMEYWSLPFDDAGSSYYVHSMHQPTLVYIEPTEPADFKVFRGKLFDAEYAVYNIGFAGYYETP